MVGLGRAGEDSAAFACIGQVSLCDENEGKGVYTERGEIIFVVIGEVVAFTCRAVMELDVDDVVRVLVGHFDDADHVVRWSLYEQESKYARKQQKIPR
jgi:hypothetical protein